MCRIEWETDCYLDSCDRQQAYSDFLFEQAESDCFERYRPQAIADLPVEHLNKKDVKRMINHGWTSGFSKRTELTIQELTQRIAIADDCELYA